MKPERNSLCSFRDYRQAVGAEGQPQHFSQKPKSRCHHVLQAPQIDSRNEAANAYVTWTPMHYVETRTDEQTLFAAWATHTLTVEDGRLKIKLKRVDLVNCDAALGNIQLFI